MNHGMETEWDIPRFPCSPNGLHSCFRIMPESSILEALNKARSKQNQNKEHAKKAVVLTDTASVMRSLKLPLRQSQKRTLPIV